jgi:hypothetical protein
MSAQSSVQQAATIEQHLREVCTDPRHDTLCPLPCKACADECDPLASALQSFIAAVEER